MTETMRQVAQNLRGEVRVLEVPAPSMRTGGLLVRTEASVISPGTERTNVERSRRSLLARARERPDLVRQILLRLKREGLRATTRGVQEKLDGWIAMGYSASGVVEGVGEGVLGFKVGDRVACAGGGYAVHAELLWVPERLCAKVPEGVPAESAAYTTIGAIALQGVRQAGVQVGEVVGVLGLGLVGLLTVQLLTAAGCVVVACDFDGTRRELARRLGAGVVGVPDSGFEAMAMQVSRGRGLDAVIVTAASSDPGPIHQAGRISRDRGRVVVVGAVPVDIPRNPFYEREIEIRFSRSYGPGRYDPTYEEGGHDYPVGYVRWTEQRNLEGVLDLMATGRLSTEALTSHRFPILEAASAYELLTGDQRSLAIVLTYPRPAGGRSPSPRVAAVPGRLRIGLIGPGGFARNVLLPAIRAVPGVELGGVAAATGLSAASIESSAGFAFAETDWRRVVEDPTTSVVFIATRHHLHAEQVIATLEAGKHVFVEKPLCLDDAELAAVERAWEHAAAGSRPSLLMVGFNRRFAPLVAHLQELLRPRTGPLHLHYRVNAGAVPTGHWVHDVTIGGGRIVGEGCHFLDLMSAVAGSPAERVFAEATAADSVAITVRYGDGSVGVLEYLSGGHPAVPKERLEVVGGGGVLVLDDFSSLTWWLPGGHGKKKLRVQDKGHYEEVARFLAAVKVGGESPISFDAIRNTMFATFRAVDAVAAGCPLPVGPSGDSASAPA